MAYNPHYFRYDALFALLLTLGLLLAIHQSILPISFAEFGGRLLMLLCYSLSFAVTGFVRTLLQEQREAPRVRKGTKILPPRSFNHVVQGDGLGIPHKNTLLHIRAEDEATHIQVVGDTGTGKTALLHYFLHQIRERRNEQVIIYDPSGEYWQVHSQPEDIWLCPFSDNCPYWDLAGEITDTERLPQLLAKSFIRPESEGRVTFWERGARAIMAPLLRNLRRQYASPHDLIRWMGDVEFLTALVQGTAAYHFIDPKAGEQRAGVLATLATAAEELRLLPKTAHDRPRFSFAEWVQQRRGWLYIGAHGIADQELLQPLISIWFDIAIRQLTQSKKANQATWIFIDELASLEHLSALPKAIDQARKYNTRLCLGFQGKAQMFHYYRHLSETMLSAASTAIFLRHRDSDSATWAAKAIGRPEVEQELDSHSWSISGDRENVNARRERRESYIIYPNEIQNLPKRQGYLRYGQHVTPIVFDYPAFAASPSSVSQVSESSAAAEIFLPVALPAAQES